MLRRVTRAPCMDVHVLDTVDAVVTDIVERSPGGVRIYECARVCVSVRVRVRVRACVRVCVYAYGIACRVVSGSSGHTIPRA